MMDNKKIIIICVSAVAVAIVIFSIYKQKIFFIQPAVQTQKEPQFPSVEEALFQKQTQEILTTGKESDCASLTDRRYQHACYGFFRIQKK